MRITLRIFARAIRFRLCGEDSGCVAKTPRGRLGHFEIDEAIGSQRQRDVPSLELRSGEGRAGNDETVVFTDGRDRPGLEPFPALGRQPVDAHDASRPGPVHIDDRPIMVDPDEGLAPALIDSSFG
jgi:hypothetical protein